MQETVKLHGGPLNGAAITVERQMVECAFRCPAGVERYRRCRDGVWRWAGTGPAPIV